MPVQDQTTKDHATLTALIKQKKSSLEPQDGRIEIALAIAAVSSLVTVDATKDPFETVPDNLFDLNFNDPKVGISDDQMTVFKADLTHLLPEIATDISNIPENSALPIEKVAEFVEVSLASAQQSNS